MRRWVVLMLLATNLAHAQVDACVPALDSASLDRVDVVDQRCGIHLQSYIYEAGSELRGDISIGLDANDAIRVLQNSDDPPFTLVQPNGITHAGRDESIYWGVWNAATGARSAMPYVAGVASRSLPSAVVRYSLVGSPVIVSGHNNTGAHVRNADHRSNPIDPGPISRADLTVNFGTGTATLNLGFTVRGVGGNDTIEFRRRKFPSLEFEAVDCEIAHTCTAATLRFYGQGATHAGVLLRVYYERVMPDAARVAATLSNVTGIAAIALRPR